MSIVLDPVTLAPDAHEERKGDAGIADTYNQGVPCVHGTFHFCHLTKTLSIEKEKVYLTLQLGED